MTEMAPEEVVSVADVTDVLQNMGALRREGAHAACGSADPDSLPPPSDTSSR